MKEVKLVAGARRGFSKERHTALKATVAGVSVAGFAAAWAGFAGAHTPAPVEAEAVAAEATTGLLASNPATASPAVTIAPATPTAVPTTAAISPTAAASPSAPTATRQSQAPIATSTPAPALPTQPAPSTPTQPLPTATVAPKADPTPTPTRTAKRTRAS